MHQRDSLRLSDFAAEFFLKQWSYEHFDWDSKRDIQETQLSIGDANLRKNKESDFDSN